MTTTPYFARGHTPARGVPRLIALLLTAILLGYLGSAAFATPKEDLQPAATPAISTHSLTLGQTMASHPGVGSSATTFTIGKNKDQQVGEPRVLDALTSEKITFKALPPPLQQEDVSANKATTYQFAPILKTWDSGHATAIAPMQQTGRRMVLFPSRN